MQYLASSRIEHLQHWGILLLAKSAAQCCCKFFTQARDIDLRVNSSDIWITILIHPEPHTHVKNLLSGNIRTTQRMYRVLQEPITRSLHPNCTLKSCNPVPYLFIFRTVRSSPSAIIEIPSCGCIGLVTIEDPSSLMTGYYKNTRENPRGRCF